MSLTGPTLLSHWSNTGLSLVQHCPLVAIGINVKVNLLISESRGHSNQNCSVDLTDDCCVLSLSEKCILLCWIYFLQYNPFEGMNLMVSELNPVLCIQSLHRTSWRSLFVLTCYYVCLHVGHMGLVKTMLVYPTHTDVRLCLGLLSAVWHQEVRQTKMHVQQIRN